MPLFGEDEESSLNALSSAADSNLTMKNPDSSASSVIDDNMSVTTPSVQS